MTLRAPDYERGDVKLWLGDCLEILPELEAGSVDAVVTDFPYGINLTTKTSDYRKSSYFDNGESLRASVLYEDSREHVEKLIAEAMPEIFRVSSRALVFPGPAMMFAYPEPSTVGCVYLPNGAGRCSWGFQCFHPILFYGKDPYMQHGMGARPNSFRTEQPNKEKIDHPCPKPVSWMQWAVNRASLAGELVCDCLMGSGTTGVACLRTGRKFIGVEIGHGYFDIAVRRIEAEFDRMPLLETPPPAHRQRTMIEE